MKTASDVAKWTYFWTAFVHSARQVFAALRESWHPYLLCFVTKPRKTVPSRDQQKVTAFRALADADVLFRAFAARLLPAAALSILLGCGRGSTRDITPPAVRDSTAPTVTATMPANGAVDAALNATLSITFSEPLNPATLTTTSVTVVTSGGGVGATIAGSVTFSGTSGTFTPATPLVGSMRYTATITTAVKDLAGNSLASDYVWSFTTVAPPDVTPPTVISSTPVNDAVNIAVTVAPTVTMSEAMNAATFNASTIVLSKAGDGTPIVGTVTVTGNTATLQPTAALAAATKYTMMVTTGAKDLAGNALAAAASWSFTTSQPPAPEIWRSEEPGFVTSPVVDVAGRLLSQVSLVNFFGLDVATGAVAWTTTQPYSAFGSFTLGSLFAINGTYVDPATGSVLWTPDRAMGWSLEVLVIGETIVLRLIGDTVLAGFDRRTGREKWRNRLGPLNCQDATFCGLLRPIGVDGANGYVLRTSSNEAQLISLSENGIVREVVAASEVARRVNMSRQMAVVHGTTMIVAWTLFGTGAGIDVVTGAERWRSDFSTFGSGFAPSPTEKSFFTPDGTLLFLQFDGISEAQAVQQVVLNTVTGAVANRRTLSLSEYRVGFWSRCGAEGMANLTTGGFEYTNLRTGARTSVARTGLFDSLVADFISEMYPVGTDRVLLTRRYGNSPMVGVKCAP